MRGVAIFSTGSFEIGPFLIKNKRLAASVSTTDVYFQKRLSATSIEVDEVSSCCGYPYSTFMGGPFPFFMSHQSVSHQNGVTRFGVTIFFMNPSFLIHEDDLKLFLLKLIIVFFLVVSVSESEVECRDIWMKFKRGSLAGVLAPQKRGTR